MEVRLDASFERDLRQIRDAGSRRRVARVIEDLERASTISDISGTKGYGQGDACTGSVPFGMIRKELQLTNRSNQLNPNNDLYWQARGFNRRPKDWKDFLKREKSAQVASKATTTRRNSNRNRSGAGVLAADRFGLLPADGYGRLSVDDY